MPVFPSEEWSKALEDILYSDEEYKKEGAEWEGDTILVIEAEPEKLDKTFYYYSNPYHGELLESRRLDSLEGQDAAFVISGPYSVWKSIVKGEVDAVQMMMKGKLRLKGDMQYLLRFARFQQIGMRALSKVETVFVDEQ